MCILNKLLKWKLNIWNYLDLYLLDIYVAVFLLLHYSTAKSGNISTSTTVEEKFLTNIF
jgi:hypothetical protein